MPGVKRMAGEAAAAAEAEGGADAEGGVERDDCSAAPVSPWPAIPGRGSANARTTFLASCNSFMANRSVCKAKAGRSG